MKRNVGTPDQIFRVVLGFALLSLLVLIDGPWRWAGLVGIVPLATAVFGFCPLYAILGLSTCDVAKEA
jgi:Inner membrane protein YgaP-like, transmembrane domain